MTNLLIGLGFSKAHAGDISLLLIMLVASIVLMFVVKKSKIGAFAFAVYAAYFVTNFLYSDFIKTYSAKIISFLLLAIGLHYLVFKPTVVVKLGSGRAVRWLKRIIISLSVVGLMTMIIIGWMPDKEIVKFFSPVTLKIFSTKFAKFAWSIAPLISIFILKKRED